MNDTASTRTALLPLLALIVVPALLHLAIVETSHGHFGDTRVGALFKLGVVSAAALAHWAIYLGLLLTFGVTLRAGHEPLITAMTRKLHGELADDLARYTRGVTIAWCGFFAMQLTTSVLLFCLAPLVVWSFFVNILDLPLVMTMFAAEYMFRLRYLRNPPRHTLKVIVGMILESAQRPPAASRPAYIAPDRHRHG